MQCDAQRSAFYFHFKKLAHAKLLSHDPKAPSSLLVSCSFRWTLTMTLMISLFIYFKISLKKTKGDIESLDQNIEMHFWNVH